MCVVQNGAAKCWGANSLGQIGLGVSNFTNIDVPTTVPGLETGVTKVAVGDFHSCAIHNGGLKCWGDNFSGQLGVSTNFDTFDEIPSPVQVQGLSSNVTDRPNSLSANSIPASSTQIRRVVLETTKEFFLAFKVSAPLHH